MVITNVTITPRLWKHMIWPITFTLVVDNFSIKYEQQEYMDHLITAHKTKYTLTEDWTGNLYCIIKLNWDCKKQTLDISMPG